MKSLLFVLVSIGIAIGLPASAATTSQDVDIVITHDPLCVNGPQIAIDKVVYAPGEPIIITTTCGSGNPRDWVTVYTNISDIGPQTGVYMTYLGVSTSSATVALKAPNAMFDRDLQYKIVWYANDSFVRVLNSSPFTVRKTTSPAAPTASLPPSLAADPFTPDHVITVCASGCDHTSLGEATEAAFIAGWDNTQVKIWCGRYDFPAHTFGQRFPAHLWIKGICADGKTYPHLFGFTQHAGRLITNGNFHATGSVTLDNLEIGPWNYWTIVPVDGQTWTLRNVYVRDTAEGLISGSRTDFTLNIYNSVFSRNGGSDGPEHNVYVGEGANGVVVNVINSAFDQAIYGHSFKQRALVFNTFCSMFAINEDDFYLGSETIDMDSGQPTVTNSLFVNGGGAPKSWTDNQSWDNLRYGADTEVTNTPGLRGLQPTRPLFNSNIFVADQPNSAHWFVTLGLPLAKPVTWSNNKFVWPDAGSQHPGPGGQKNADATGALQALHSGNTNDVTLDGTNQFFTSRAAAGLPAVGAYPKGWRDYLPLMPAACTDPVGLVKIPTN